MSVLQVVAFTCLVSILVYSVGWAAGGVHHRIHCKRFGLPLSVVAAVGLSGCLTAAKIHHWESALLGWARKGGPECVDAAKVASKYLTNANRTLQDATSALDLAADGEAKKLMTEAAQKCGEVVP